MFHYHSDLTFIDEEEFEKLITESSSFNENDYIKSNEIKKDPLESLTETQQMAATWHNSPLLILAGAGTGKTKTLTSRIGWLIEENKINHWNVLAVTFTRKAAREMKIRLSKIIGPAALAMDIGTFHSINAKILRDNAEFAGLSPEFTILDTEDQKAIIKELYSKLQQGEEIAPPPEMEGEKLTVDYNAILDWIEKSSTGRPTSTNDLNNTWLTAKGADKLKANYEEAKNNNNALDYTDILVKGRNLIRDNENVRNYYKNLWKAILIDEYQDTNTIQEEWIELISNNGQGCHFTCVGDDDQSVYSWRGAEITNILTFDKRYKNAEIIRLEQNFRSQASILTVANTLISGNSNRHGKTLYTHSEHEDPVRIIQFPDDRSEAQTIINHIEKEIEKGQQYNDFAIIARSASVLRSFQPLLTLKKFPYTVTAGRKYNETAEIKALTAYMRLMINRADNQAFRHALGIRPRGFGKESIQTLADTSLATNIPMIDIMKSQVESGNVRKSAKDNLSSFIEFIEEISEDYQFNIPIKGIIERIIIEAKLRERSDEYRTKAESSNDYKKSEKLIKQADAIDERIDQYLEEALNQTNIIDFVDAMSLSETNENLENAIWLGTIHAAKGLEFNTVYLPGWERNLFPSSHKDTNHEEERRLAYVAMTRAKHKLSITHAIDRIIRNDTQQSNEANSSNDEITHENCYISELKKQSELINNRSILILKVN